MAKDTFYFSHDYNARNDAKIKKLISKHGFLGYGIFWAIVEDLYNNANALPTDYESIAFDLRTDAETIKSIIKDFDLFVFENETFGSSSIEKRLNERNEKSIKARESASKRWSKLKEDANALRTQSDGNAIKESIVKENKENESKEKKIEYTHKLQIYVSGLKNVSKLRDQLSHEDCEKLIAAFDKKLIEKKLLAMENKKTLQKDYTSVYLTLKNWCESDPKNTTEKQSSYNPKAKFTDKW